MIDVRTLRFGNIVAIDYQNSEKLPCAVLIIDGANSGVFTDLAEHLFVSGEDLHPIPLTEEWLLSFGFEPNLGVFTKSRSEELGHDFGNFSVSFYDDTQMKVWKGGRYIGVIGSCGFVHQFQNLTFALTGQELTIKIKQ